MAKLLNVYRYNFPETTIIVANPTLRIYWSGVSILEAGLDCMEQLVNANADWKFFSNAIGTAMPGRPIRVKFTIDTCFKVVSVNIFYPKVPNKRFCPNKHEAGIFFLT